MRVKFRRMLGCWCNKCGCELLLFREFKLRVEGGADRAVVLLRAAVGPVAMCGELAMSCRIPAIRDTISYTSTNRENNENASHQT